MLPSDQCMVQMFDPLTDTTVGMMQSTPRNAVSLTQLQSGQQDGGGAPGARYMGLSVWCGFECVVLVACVVWV